ncbi:hypothetical protein AYI68_g8343 [Smittium mucronatum]|uniref:Uncharacterized protein n=1 Tax=Smittium mucronatum TaxID=133383 RepID=A0A1R0GL62_9FUNG|nr:hypothetical protein AYI68_g8343 [Smittium mucronatum]
MTNENGNVPRKLKFSDKSFTLFLYIDSESLLKWLSVPCNIRQYCLDNDSACKVIKKALTNFKELGSDLIKEIIDHLYERYQIKIKEYGGSPTSVPLNSKMDASLPEYSFFYKAFHFMHVAIWTIEAEKYRTDFDMNNTHTPFLSCEESSDETEGIVFSFENSTDSNDFNNHKKLYANLKPSLGKRSSLSDPVTSSSLFSGNSGAKLINERLEHISKISLDLKTPAESSPINSSKSNSLFLMSNESHQREYQSETWSKNQQLFSDMGAANNMNQKQYFSRNGVSDNKNVHSHNIRNISRSFYIPSDLNNKSTNLIKPELPECGKRTISNKIPHSFRNILNPTCFKDSNSLSLQTFSKENSSPFTAPLTPESKLDLKSKKRKTSIPDHVMGLNKPYTNSLEFAKNKTGNSSLRNWKNMTHGSCLNNRPIPLAQNSDSKSTISQLRLSPKPQFMNSIRGNFLLNSTNVSHV